MRARSRADEIFGMPKFLSIASASSHHEKDWSKWSEIKDSNENVFLSAVICSALSAEPRRDFLEHKTDEIMIKRLKSHDFSNFTQRLISQT